MKPKLFSYDFFRNCNISVFELGTVATCYHWPQQNGISYKELDGFNRLLIGGIDCTVYEFVSRFKRNIKMGNYNQVNNGVSNIVILVLW